MVAPPLPGLSLAPGLSIQREVRSSLGLPVSCAHLSASSFALVVAFGRCKFHLSADSVSLLLQATIGGSAPHFHVSQLGDRVFKFFVSSKPVGFFVRNLRSFECNLFKLSFHLWGRGGPDWRREWKLFVSEEEASWSKVGSKKSLEKSFADVVRNIPLSGANRAPIGIKTAPKPNVFDRLSFPRVSVFDRLQPSAQNLQLEPSLVKAKASSSSGQGHFLAHMGCSRCLSPSHSRRNCSQPIRCHACKGSGHVVVSCTVQAARAKRHSGDNFGNQEAATITPNVPTLGSQATNSSSPPVFGSFSEMARATFPPWALAKIGPVINIPWRLQPVSLPGGPEEVQTSPVSPTNVEPSHWTLGLDTASTTRKPQPLLSRASTLPAPFVGIKARVLDLQSVPHFIIFSETAGLEGTVQCEILQHQLLGGGPPDEEPVPGDNVIGNNAFQFFGLGQQVNAPVFDLNQAQQPEAKWDNWPEPQEQAQHNPPPQQPQAPAPMQLDLNLPVGQMDFQEIIVNPPAPENNESFLEVNELIQQAAQELHLPQPQRAEAELLALVDELNDQDLQPPVVPGEEGFPEQDDVQPPLEAQQQDDPMLDDHHAPDNNVQTGLILTRPLGPDPGLLDGKRAKEADATRLWAKHFNSGTASALHLKVPHNWANFFTVMLLNPDFFSWAKDFLASQAKELLFTSTDHINFSIPSSCPVNSSLPCLIESGEEEIVNSSLSGPTELQGPSPKSGRKRRGGKETVVLETYLRRSNRVRKVCNGFKPSICMNKKCLACTPDPPTLSVKVIKNLGAAFCKV